MAWSRCCGASWESPPADEIGARREICDHVIVDADMEAVARLAGVSTATVSRALRGLPSVRPETRERVEAAARKLGYWPSRAAVNLATGRTLTIGLLTPWLRSWYSGQVLDGAAYELHQHGYDALLYSFGLDPAAGRRPVDPQTLRRRVDAVIVFGLIVTDTELQILDSLKVPVVFVGSGPKGYHRVLLDDEDAVARAAAHLAELGHRVVAHVGGPHREEVPWAPAARRFRAFERATATHGFDPDQRLRTSGDFDPQTGTDAARRILEARPDVTAFFADNDEIAFGVITELRAQGIAVPQEVSVIGIDGIDFGEVLGLSTMAQDAVGQGAAGARRVLALLAGEQPDADAASRTEFIDRGSTAPARRGAVRQS